MAGAHWRKCSSTSPAAMATHARLRNERAARDCTVVLAAPRGGDDAALLVPVAFIVAAAARSHLLADGADDHLGISAILYHDECRLLRARRRHIHRRRAAVGYPIPRP